MVNWWQRIWTPISSNKQLNDCCSTSRRVWTSIWQNTWLCQDTKAEYTVKLDSKYTRKNIHTDTHTKNITTVESAVHFRGSPALIQCAFKMTVRWQQQTEKMTNMNALSPKPWATRSCCEQSGLCAAFSLERPEYKMTRFAKQRKQLENDQESYAFIILNQRPRQQLDATDLQW
jgi:hypothetical protein